MPQILRIMPPPARRSAAAGIARLHQVLADQERANSRPRAAARYPPASWMPLSLTRSAPAGHVLRQPQRSFERDLEGGEIAIVDADDVGAGRDGRVQFAPVVHFDQRGHAVARRSSRKSRISRSVEDRGDQQDGIRAVRRRFQDLRRRRS